MITHERHLVAKFDLNKKHLTIAIFWLDFREVTFSNLPTILHTGCKCECHPHIKKGFRFIFTPRKPHQHIVYIFLNLLVFRSPRYVNI